MPKNDNGEELVKCPRCWAVYPKFPRFCSGCQTLRWMPLYRVVEAQLELDPDNPLKRSRMVDSRRPR